MTETTQDSLNVRLAKWAGWRVEARQLDGDDRYYVLFRPDGTQVAALDGGYEVDEFWTASEAWRHAPDYAGSLDAGMALVHSKVTNCTSVWFALIGDKPVVSIQYDKPNAWYPGDVISETVAAEGDTDSEALANALDALRQQQEA